MRSWRAVSVKPPPLSKDRGGVGGGTPRNLEVGVSEKFSKQFRAELLSLMAPVSILKHGKVSGLLSLVLSPN